MTAKSLKLACAGVLGFAIGFLSSLHAQPAERFDLKVRQDFFSGFSGNADAMARGMKACEATLAADPKNAEAMVWHGGGLLFQAGMAFQSGDQQTGGTLWARGMKEMQTAVDLEPDNVGVRIPRGAVLLALSRFVPTAEIAKPLIAEGLTDYEHTYEIQKPRFETLGSHPRGELLFGIAEGNSRLGDQAKAEKFFELIRTDLPNTVYAKRAAAWMETKTLPVEQTQCVGCHVAK